jgi:hypothetical protein
MMRCNVAPFVKFRQILKTGHVYWAGSHQIQFKSKALIVIFQVLQIRISAVEGAIGRKLRLDKDSERSTHPLTDNLRRFGVQVATEPLDVRAEQNDVATHILFIEPWVGWS